MMSRSLLKSVRTKLADFIHLQLFLTLISWPILIAWGLPLSLMSLLGNFIFGPVVTLFLFVSALIFFCELVGIPNGSLVWLLDKITDWWVFIMHHSSSRWLISAPAPSLLALAVLPFCALAILYFKP